MSTWKFKQKTNNNKINDKKKKFNKNAKHNIGFNNKIKNNNKN